MCVCVCVSVRGGESVVRAGECVCAGERANGLTAVYVVACVRVDALKLGHALVGIEGSWWMVEGCVLGFRV